MLELLDVLSKEEKAAFTLRSLYANYGYSQYKMSKFEEYDLYVKNKDFLVSESVITFTDTDGKLMALKPDVTLSIIKNSKDVEGKVMKVYYNENVYRVSKGTLSFKEIMQAGLECLGEVDDEIITEAIFLAVKSLEVISSSSALEISHLDLVLEVINAFNLSDFAREEVLRYLGEKNSQGVTYVCEREGLTKEQTELMQKLVTVYGAPRKVLPMLKDFCINESTVKAVNQLTNIITSLQSKGVADKIFIDFSVVNDMKYYNGLAFKGFVEGLPVSIISGGQYDKLMNKMGKKAKAVGFAVYLDEISKLPDLSKGGNL
ncbi:MAG: ATP phosphoribosyltransferase regulatory subunit [Clostridia bacterium]|nr:ATP phosphoribosyltransferase regulatory subunit [Clostridia bacterium]